MGPGGSIVSIKHPRGYKFRGDVSRIDSLIVTCVVIAHKTKLLRNCHHGVLFGFCHCDAFFDVDFAEDEDAECKEDDKG